MTILEMEKMKMKEEGKIEEKNLFINVTELLNQKVSIKDIASQLNISKEDVLEINRIVEGNRYLGMKSGESLGKIKGRIEGFDRGFEYARQVIILLNQGDSVEKVAEYFEIHPTRVEAIKEVLKS